MRLRHIGLTDVPRSGAPRTITDAKVERVVTLTLERKPAHATRWSTRSLAKRCGLTHDAVHRIWRAFGLKPHRQETFQLSTDPVGTATKALGLSSKISWLSPQPPHRCFGAAVL